MLGRPGSSDMTSPHGPGSHVGSVRRRSCRKALPRNRGGLRSCPRTRRRPLTPTRKAYSARAGPSSSPDLDEPGTARRSEPDFRDRTCLPAGHPSHLLILLMHAFCRRSPCLVSDLDRPFRHAGCMVSRSPPMHHPMRMVGPAGRGPCRRRSGRQSCGRQGRSTSRRRLTAAAIA
jgi:hypothetical protein